MVARVASLFIYPIKSCGGIEVDSFELSERGPLFDREWMIVDAVTHDFLTQRQLAAMARVKTALTKAELVVTLPSQSFSVSLKPPTHPPTIEVTVWKEKCEAFEEPEGSRVFSDFLGRSVKLVRLAPEFQRRRFAKLGMDDRHTGFADGYPLLIASLDSLADLNSRLDTRVPIDRFRANIIIEGAPAFAEDEWKQLKVGALGIDIVKPCERCVIITTDQQTGARSAEPLKTLAGYRRNSAGKVIFAQNAIHLDKGLVRKGDAVTLRS